MDHVPESPCLKDDVPGRDGIDRGDRSAGGAKRLGSPDVARLEEVVLLVRGIEIALPVEAGEKRVGLCPAVPVKTPVDVLGKPFESPSREVDPDDVVFRKDLLDRSAESDQMKDAPRRPEERLDAIPEIESWRGIIILVPPADFEIGRS